MAERILIASGNHDVFRVGNNVLKVFKKGFPKVDVLNEAINVAQVENLGLNVPKLLAISVVEDNRWAITYEYIEGKTLEQLMKENPEKRNEYISMLVDLQISMHAKKCPALGRLKEKMTRQIQSLEDINESTRYELLTRLDGMPKHHKLCHGDFSPKNIIVNDQGLHILDWVHASQGNASADVARTYLLLALEDLDIAYQYLNTFCERSETDKRYIQSWLPIVAAAQLTKKRPEEAALLSSWIDVCEYV